MYRHGRQYALIAGWALVHSDLLRTDQDQTSK